MRRVEGSPSQGVEGLNGISLLGAGPPVFGGGRFGRPAPARHGDVRWEPASEPASYTASDPAIADGRAACGAWSLDQATRQALAEVGWVPSSTQVRATGGSTSFRFALSNPAFGARVEGSFDQQTFEFEASVELEPAPGTQAFTRAFVRFRWSVTRAAVQASWGGQRAHGAGRPDLGGLAPGPAPLGVLTDLMLTISDIARQVGRKRVTLIFDDPAAVGVLGERGGHFARGLMDLVQMIMVASEIAFRDDPDVTHYDIHVKGPKGSGSVASAPPMAAFAAGFELTYLELSLSAEIVAESGVPAGNAV